MKKLLTILALGALANSNVAVAAEGPIYGFCSRMDRWQKMWVTQIFTVSDDAIEGVPSFGKLMRTSYNDSEMHWGFSYLGSDLHGQWESYAKKVDGYYNSSCGFSMSRQALVDTLKKRRGNGWTINTTVERNWRPTGAKRVLNGEDWPTN